MKDGRIGHHDDHHEKDDRYTNDDTDDEECQERLEAEFEFVSSAYNAEEAWYEKYSLGEETHHDHHDINSTLPCNNNSSHHVSAKIHRRLHLRAADEDSCNDDDDDENEGIDGDHQYPHQHNPSLSIILRLTLTAPRGYPVRKALEVDGTIENPSQQHRPPPPSILAASGISGTDSYSKSRRTNNKSNYFGISSGRNSSSTTSTNLHKTALNAIPSLLLVCRQVVEENIGEETIFAVLNAAEEWLHNDWPVFRQVQQQQQQKQQLKKTIPLSSKGSHRTNNNDITICDVDGHVVLGRRLIYSHHIISKQKRCDIKELASDLDLTGYMKIGWPGLLIIEGREEDCNEFYDVIRRWSWQYLVLRGEQQQEVVVVNPSNIQNLNFVRLFDSFVEVESMSVVAEKCRQVGLEALFLTSMKLYGDDGNLNKDIPTINDPLTGNTVSSLTSSSWYGILVHVDHMNDGKGYRKWLRRTCKETDCYMLLKQWYTDGDYTNKPTILVGIVGDNTDVSTFMKRWRTSRVDVDSKGTACLERQMKVLIEGPLRSPAGDPSETIDWDKAASEKTFTTSVEQMERILQAVGGDDWSTIGPLRR